MSYIPIQTNVGNLGNGGSGSVSFSNPQTAKNANVGFSWGLSPYTLTGGTNGTTDTSTNTYLFEGQQSTNTEFTVAIELCAAIAAHGPGNAVTTTWSGGDYVDSLIAEFAGPFSGVGVKNTNFQFGGTSAIPTITLTGTTPGSLIVAICTSGNILPAAGNIGGVAAAWSANDSPAGSDKFCCQSGGSVSTSTAVTFGTTTDDYWAIVVVELLYVSQYNAIFFGSD